MVHAEAHCRVVLAANGEKRHHGTAYLLKFRGILLVGILQFLERARGIDKVAGIDAHLVGRGGCLECGFGIEMDVGDKRLGVACGMEGGADFTDIVRLAHSLCGQTHIVGSSVEDAAALRHAGVGVERRGRCHRLYPYRIVASKRHVTYLHCRGVTAAVVEVVHSGEMLSLS